MLRQILEKLPKPNHPDLLVGVNTIDDAGVFRLNDNLAAEDFVGELKSQGVEFARIIGQVTKEHPGQVIVSNGQN